MIPPHGSIVFKLILFTSAILTAIFVCTGYLLEKNISVRSTNAVEQEIGASFRAYESLWNEHTQDLRQISRVISRMPDVRAAFSTNDRATIRDSASEIWSRLSAGNALFTVTDGKGNVLATTGGSSPFRLEERLSFLEAFASGSAQQTTGFFALGHRLYQLVVTPVYVDTPGGQGLICILVTGFELDRNFLRALKMATGESELIFDAGKRVFASTLTDTGLANRLGRSCGAVSPGKPVRFEEAGVGYLALNRPLPSLLPGGASQLCMVRSLANSERGLHELLRGVFFLWLSGLLAAIFGTYAILRKLLHPVAKLDRAAAEIAAGNYRVRVAAQTQDELGRLARSFNTMCDSLEEARAELIRNERLNSVARLATFVVHDLRNPLASIYAGAEMLVDNDLPEKQVKRLARNMYNASRGVLDILSELLSTARNRPHELEACLLHDLIANTWNGLVQRGETKAVRFELNVPAELELTLDRVPMERVFHNLFENAVEAISGSGTIRVWSETSTVTVLLHIEDSGRGIPEDLKPILFQPFATSGGLGGLGLGLALSKQTVAAHGGDLWADFHCRAGSHFLIRLPADSEAPARKSEGAGREKTGHPGRR